MTLRDDLANLNDWVSGAHGTFKTGVRKLGWTADSFFAGFPGCQHPGGHP